MNTLSGILRYRLFTLIILIGAISLFGCTNSKNMDTTLKYLALGDSYTIGVSVAEHERWPVLFAKKLETMGVEVEEPRIIAQNGWTTTDLQDSINKAAINENFDIVSLCIGVNNQYQGKDIEEYRTELKALLQTAIEFAGDRKENVIVLSIPNWGLTPFAKDRDISLITKQIELFNTVKKEECKKAGIEFINITPLTIEVVENPELLAKDSLHYSGKMHKRWVDEVIKNTKNMSWNTPSKKQ